jgi:hypothetical protein
MAAATPAEAKTERLDKRNEILEPKIVGCVGRTLNQLFGVHQSSISV